MLSTAKIRRGSWRYLQRQVPRGLCEYFHGLGEAPGRWYGRGLEPLALDAGARVSERELEAMFGRALHPKSNTQLGRAWRADGVTGYDLCFSAPKSVSALWVLGGDDISRAVRAAHGRAVRVALDYLDSHASHSRVGVDGLTQVATDGLAAAVFDHRTSRAGDPQLHSHALVVNKVRCPDGGWRTIDGHEIYAHKKSAGALYQWALRNELTRTLGVSWTPVSKDGQAEVAGVPVELIRLWSKRSVQTLAEAGPLIAAYEQRLGRPLTSAERTAVTKVAVIKTRPTKDPVDIVALVDRWIEEAATTGWTPDRLQANVRAARRPLPDHDRVAARIDAALADAVTAAGARRAVFTRSDLAGELAARLPAVGFTAEMTRELLERLTDRALATDEAVPLLPRHDGPVRLSDARFAARATLALEAQVLDIATGGRDLGVGVVDLPILTAATLTAGLDPSQAGAVRRLCGEGEAVSVLIAPAGTGKTHTLAAATEAWQTDLHHVITLAPTARAAKELGTATGTPADTVAKFLHEHGRATPFSYGPDYLRYHVDDATVVIVDEASMLATTDLHQLSQITWNAGAKLVLVGDPAQISAIDRAGGMLPLLARHLDAPTLDVVHRFTHRWERDASLRLRAGDPTVAEIYLRRGRIHAPTPGQDGPGLVEDLFAHYTRLTATGARVLMLARRHDDVDDLNTRARRHAIDTGAVHGEPLITTGEKDWRVGDVLRVTRNDRRIRLGTDHLRNGDTFTVTGRTRTGLTVRRLDSPDVTVLPFSYLAEYARYGWASTIDAAQGATVDHALLLARPGLDRTHLYVGLTRGRASNHLYLAPAPEPEITPRQTEPRPVDPAAQLRAMLTDPGDDAAAHARLPGRQQPPTPTPTPRPSPRRRTPLPPVDRLARAQQQRAARRRDSGYDHHHHRPGPDRGLYRDR